MFKFGWWIVIVGHAIALYSPGTVGSGTISFDHADKVMHLALFAAPAYALRRATDRWWPVLLLTLHAPLSELIQHQWIPHRRGDPLDVLADWVGVGVGVALAHAVRGRLSSRPECPPG